MSWASLFWLRRAKKESNDKRKWKLPHLEAESVKRSVMVKKSQRARETSTRDRQGAGLGPNTELVRTRLLGPQPGASHNHSHSGLLECVPWKFRQVSYLWKISCSLVSRHCSKQTTSPTAHKHTHAISPTWFSIPPLFFCVQLSKRLEAKHKEGCYSANGKW